MFNGQTLTSGGTLIISGTTYLLPTGGTVPAIVTGSFPTSISIGTLTQGPGVVIDGTTVTPGGTIIVSGTTYLLPPGATVPVPVVTGAFTTTGSGAGPSGSSTPTGFVQVAGASQEKSSGLSAGFAAFMGIVQLLIWF